MNLTNDGLKIITADKLELDMVIPGKLTGHDHTVTYVLRNHRDSLLGTCVLVHTWNEEEEFSGVYKFRTFDKITVKP